MKSKSLLCSDIEELKLKLQEFSANDFNPNLAFVFANDKCDIDKIDALLNEFNIKFIGCSTAGEIQNNKLAIDHIGLLMMEIQQDYYLVESGDYSESIYQSAFRLGKYAKESFNNPGIIVFSGGIAVDGFQLVEGIKESAGADIPIFGGLGGNNMEFLKTNVYTNGFYSSNGFVAIVFDTDKIRLKGTAISGWDGLGMLNTITKCEGNVLYEINGAPALTELKKFFGEELFMRPEHSDSDVIAFPGQFPLQVYRENGSSFLRAIVYINLKDNSAILAGSVPEHAKFKYCPNPDINVVTDTVEYYKEKLGDGSDIDAVLMISCLIRYHSFGMLFEDEVNSIFNLWNKPMAGFLSYGEIGNTGEDDLVEFHNATCSLVSLSEV